MLSVIVPTYNERDNIERLVRVLQNIFRSNSIKAEIVVVDDNSPDRTSDVVRKMMNKYGNVKLVQRPGKLGLSSAVIAGFKRSRGEIVCVMDADFSHPPEKIVDMFRAVQNADVVIGSRYVPGGRIENWPAARRITSLGATLLAKPLTTASDPVSGFFMFRRNVIRGAPLNPRGYKIGLEIIVKGKYGRIAEVPIVFVNRKKGKTKLNIGEYVNYLLNLSGLYAYSLGKAKRLKTL